MKILYTNAACLSQTKLAELKILINEETPDILGITEVFPKHSLFEQQEVFYDIENYDLFLSNLRKGRGVALYVKKQLNPVQALIQSDFEESVWCKINLQNRDCLIVGCVYRSPNAERENLNNLKEIFQIIKEAKYSHKLVIGDFNFRDIDWTNVCTYVSEEHIASQFLECVRDTYFFQHVKQPTRIREGNEPTVLDLIFSNEEEMVSNLNYLSGLGRSDHLVLAFKFNCYNTQEPNTSTRQRLNFFKGDYITINQELEDKNWHNFFKGLNLLQSWTEFAELCVKLMEKYIPVSSSDQAGGKCKNLNRSCLQAVKEKRKKWLKYKYCKSDNNYNNYKAARNRVTYELRHAKYNYEKELSSKIKSNNKIFWNYVRSKSKIKSSVSKLQMKNGSLSSSDQETATTLNSYFTSVFEPKIDKPLPDFPVRPYNAPLNDIDITEEHVEKAINVLKPGKSQGPDNFHPKFLMETKHQVKMPLKTIFNKSLNESKLPDIWKTANVSAIFKKGEKQKPENYRPISLTSVPGKLMERIIRDAIVTHMSVNNFFSKVQHGFIRGRSCTAFGIYGGY